MRVLRISCIVLHFDTRYIRNVGGSLFARYGPNLKLDPIHFIKILPDREKFTGFDNGFRFAIA